MPAAVAVAAVATSAYSAHQQGKAAESASKAQQKSAQAGIDEQRRQFDAIQQMLAPFVKTGTGALGSMGDITGVNGDQAQQAAYNNIQSSPAFTSALKAGTDAILANASATGGLRGGNVQSALSEYSPQLLSSLIDQRYGQLGQLASFGQNAAAMTGNAGMNTANQVSNLLQQQGAAKAGGYIAQGKEMSGYANAIMNGISTYFGAGGKF